VTSPAIHTWFWFFGAVCIVGIFLAIAGVLRRRMSVIDRGSRLVAATGLLLAAGGLVGVLAVAVGAPGPTVAVLSDMVGHGPQPSAAPAPSSKPGVEKLTVTGVDFKFEPSTLTVPAGKPVEVVFDNKGTNPHTFTLEGGPSFELTTDPGGTQSGTLPALKPGTYQFICSIPGHEQLGMKGTLTVK
jgi:nitrite reductase (NO-forming)